MALGGGLDPSEVGVMVFPIIIAERAGDEGCSDDIVRRGTAG